MKSNSKPKSVRAKSVTAKTGAGTKTCVCKKNARRLFTRYDKRGQEVTYCGDCIPLDRI